MMSRRPFVNPKGPQKRDEAQLLKAESLHEQLPEVTSRDRFKEDGTEEEGKKGLGRLVHPSPLLTSTN